MQGGRDRADRGVGMDDWEGGGGASKAEVGGRTLRKLKLKVHCVLAMVDVALLLGSQRA